MRKFEAIEKHCISASEEVMSQVTCLNRIFRNVQEKGMSTETLDSLKEDIDYVSALYHIDKFSVVLLAAILENSETNHKLDDEDLAQYIGCTNIEFFAYREKLTDLESAGIIRAIHGRFGHAYKVTREVLDAVGSETEFTPPKTAGLTPDELFFKIKQAFNLYKNDVSDRNRLDTDLNALVDNNKDLDFCKQLYEAGLYSDATSTERLMFLFLCSCYVSNGNPSVPLDILMNFTDYMEDDDLIRRTFTREENFLQKSDLVCFAIEDGFMDVDAISLSDTVKAEFFCGMDVQQQTSKVKTRDLIPASTITCKELFFNSEEGAQIGRMEGLLDAENFKNVQARLEETGMRKGFNAIFYGAPGTGKTASVFELARRTGRDIFRVDMSKLKSKWVGDSEKAVRGVFKMYRSLCRNSELAPIMLFNEADAIFSKRIEHVEQSVDQMNNSIQNIILEEMENLEGILIATTNLLSNLDTAFERRFIYKIEFKLPERESREKIWKSMIPSLSDEDAGQLAEKYPFSGGNIENIVRKSMVEYVLSGNRPDLGILDGYCREETIVRKRPRQRIGF